MSRAGRTNIDPDLRDPETVEADEPEALVLDLVPEDEQAPAEGTIAAGMEVIKAAVKHAPKGPGVYRMIDAKGEVLYVGKAKSIAKRVISYARPTGLVSRIARMVAATTAMEFVSTKTETEALLLEANLIKQLRPRFNVLMRDDKSFPYILITGDHAAPRIAKHRGARVAKGDYFGPFASAWAVGRTINALERAFLVRSCTDAVFESRTRPCLLFQIKRCAGPCTGEVSGEDYAALVKEAKLFLSGRSQAVKQLLARQMEEAAEAMEFERAAVYRDRLAALSAVQATQGINPRGVEEADVFAAVQEGGQTCIQVFFFRTGQNWGNRAYYPKADRSLEAAEVLSSFIAQFYDDKPPPSQVLLSHDLEDQAVLAEALTARAGRKVEVAAPKRGEKKDLVDHAAQNAREALGRQLAESASQLKLLQGLASAFGLAAPPRRIEVYDNSHIMGTNAVGGMIVAGPEGFRRRDYRTFNIKSDIAPGDDFGMMREVLERRFKRLVKDAPKPAETGSEGTPEDAEPDSSWPDLVVIDGGPGQLSAAQAILTDLGITDVPLVAIAKGRDREAGRETFHMPARDPFRLEPRDPVLYFVQRLRDEAHRFAIGTHRGRRKKDIRSAGLAEIGGIGPARKRALLNHFGTLKAIERASLDDLQRAPGINAATAQAVYNFFHPQG
ncbi:excinuclease ABC subunit UvrC [Phreatobacter oligotrophus]|uniref:excinuclease ABC subunit UvrC n=1 Tax=Phreatobacter oligotrophus TaxID=1122261 RepID=UPI00235439AB|nr:excinuclease ABC subunit UvrC [Phreatobacter oligotrophus]MBX9991051.1 excinuclease ABC subunit UvrC [Phreatobacter oligotrophus]